MPEVGGARLDVGRHVGRPHRHDPDLPEQQLAVVGAHLGGVDPERVEQVERLAESARPRGTAMVSPFSPTARLARPSPDQRDVQPLDVRAPSRRPAAARPKRAEQVVVAPAAAERHAERAVVDLEDRARVVAQRPRQAEVEDHPLRDARRAALVERAQPADDVGRRARSAARAPPARRAAAGRAAAGPRASSASPQPPDLALQPDEVARDELVQDRRRAPPAGTPSASSSAGYSDASPSPTR